MTQVESWSLTGNPDKFRDGVAAFRHARDWAQEQRDAFIKAAKSHNPSADSYRKNDLS